MILEQFYPKEWLDSTDAIPWEQWQERGIRGVIFDIDNTLAVSYTHLVCMDCE